MALIVDNIFIKPLFISRKWNVMLVYITYSFDQKLTLSKIKKTLALSTFLGSSAKYNHKIWQSYDKLIQTKIYQT